MRTEIVFAVFLTLLLVYAGFVNASEPEWETLLSENQVNYVLTGVGKEQAIFAAAKGVIFKSADNGKNWRRVFYLGGSLKKVNQLAHGWQKMDIYAATDNGLYRSVDNGQRWELIFKGNNSANQQCLCLAALPYAVFVGSRAGLFYSEDNGRSWHMAGGEIGSACILNIDFSRSFPEYVYAAASEGLFRSLDRGKNWEKVFIKYPREDDPVENSYAQDPDKPSCKQAVNYVKVSGHKAGLLYLATNSGIYRSHEQGNNWERLPEHGLINRDVRWLSFSAGGDLLAGSASGVFVYRQDGWEELSLFLEPGKVNSIAVREKEIFIASDKGLFVSSFSGPAQGNGASPVFTAAKGEPGIRQVQEAAIEYAELNNRKIIEWRKKSARRAWLPKLNVGLDRNSTDLWHWETGSGTKADDDVLRHGQDTIDWDVSLTWDFGDLVWSEAQTSIDVRSRLMVELRNDILDQVNKIYFERLRVRNEMDGLNLGDARKRYEKQLKLEELTASLDAFTGGYFSRAAPQG